MIGDRLCLLALAIFRFPIAPAHLDGLAHEAVECGCRIGTLAEAVANSVDLTCLLEADTLAPSSLAQLLGTQLDALA